MREIIASLIESATTKSEADSFRQFIATDEVLQRVAAVGKEVLDNLPFKPGACAHLTALWVMLVRERLQIPALGVVGHLAIEGSLILGKQGDTLSRGLQDKSLDWDGHCWLVVGDHIGDIPFSARHARPSHLPSFDRRLLRIMVWDAV
jgi:hypothetical protein